MMDQPRKTAGNNARRYLAMSLVGTIPLVIELFVLEMVSSRITKSVLNAAGVYLILIYAFSLFCWYRTTKNPCSIYLMFLCYTFLCNAGQTLLSFFHDPGYEYMYIYKLYRMRDIFKMLNFQSFCVLLMNAGALCALCGTHGGYNRLSKIEIAPIRRERKWANRLFYTLSIVMIGNVLSQFALRMRYSYMEYYNSRDSLSIYITAAYFMSMIAFFLMNADQAANIKAGIVSVVIQIILYMAIGDRTAIIALAAALFFLLYMISHRFMKSRKEKLLYLGFVLAGLMALGLVSKLRTSSLMRLDYGLRGSLMPGKLLGQTIHEMGMSAQTTIMTINRIDAGTKHEQTILYYLLVAFVPRQLLNFLGFLEPHVGTLSTWITKQAGSSSGYGYSIIAEAYFDFGYPGCLFMGLFSYLFARAELTTIRKIKEGKLLYPVIGINILANTIFLARAQFDLMTSRFRLSLYLFLIWLILMEKGRLKIRSYGECINGR